jgi:hypothetical protein
VKQFHAPLQIRDTAFHWVNRHAIAHRLLSLKSDTKFFSPELSGNDAHNPIGIVSNASTPAEPDRSTHSFRLSRGT